MKDVITYTADDEEPNCRRCEHINNSDKWCAENCGGANGWNGYLRYEYDSKGVADENRRY